MMETETKIKKFSVSQKEEKVIGTYGALPQTRFGKENVTLSHEISCREGFAPAKYKKTYKGGNTMLYSLGKNKVTTLLVALMVALCLVAIGSAGVFAANPTTHNNIKITFGDTTVPTPPESLMDFTFVSGNTYHADYNGSDAATFYPSTLSIYIQPTSGSISSITSTGVDFLVYDEDGTPSVMDPVEINDDYFYTIQIADTAGTHSITVTNSSSLTFTVTFDRPKSGGTALTAAIVNGYLPGVSQYATGLSYGSISTDNNNSLANQDLVKTIRGNAGTMVSLGSSGYIQYELVDPITNADTHKWGIDFIVTGNPFSGNPEAGMVMVAEKNAQGNPGTWYRLAGSRHYEADTVMNTNVTYTKNASNIGVTYGGNTTTFGTNVNWWPLFAAKPTGENYGAASGVQTSKITNVSYPSNDTTITYQNRTVVADDATAGLSGANATNFYGYGYADVRPGSGFVNPYASLPATGGGADGFDLAWAVDAAGQPVDLTGKDIYFIQVYTSTVFNAGVFGETSTEVASFTAASDQPASVGTTSAPATMNFTAGTSSSSITGTTGNVVNKTIASSNPATTFTVTLTDSGIDNFWLNNTKATSGTAVTFDVPASGTDKYVRIVAQDDDDQPYVLLLKVHKN